VSARKRSAGEGSVYFNATRDRWEGTLDLGRGPDGKRRRRKVTAPSRAEAAKRLGELRRQVDAGSTATNGNTTVAELLDRWSSDVLPARVTPRTLGSYRWAIEEHLKPGLGSRRLDKLTPDEVDAFLKAKADAGLSRSSVVRFRGLLGQALRWAERRGMVARNVATLSDLPVDTKPAEHGRALTANEALRFLDACEHHRLGAMWTLQMALGLRPGEVAGLSWQDLDLEAEVPVVHVRSNLRWTLQEPELVAPKTSKSRRTLAIPARAVAALRRHREAQALERMVLGQHWPAQWSALVFTTEAGTPCDPPNVRRHLRKVAAAAGIGVVKPYDLRHTAATMLAESGAPLEHIADQLGHEDTNMGRHVYVHVKAPHIAVAVDPMDRLLGS
jgi:integrase